MFTKKKNKKEAERDEKFNQLVLMRSQITRMVQFMELEGKEMAMQLMERAEEEFHMVKGQLINNQRRIITVQYEKKLAKMESDSNTEVSKMRNFGRLKAFEEKQVMVDEIVEEIIYTVVQELEDDKELYLSFLDSLFLQALCMLMKDGNVMVTVREKDVKLANHILNSVSGEFKKLTGKTISPQVDTNTFLGEDSLGGAMFTSGKISVSSTIRQRIEDVVYRAMPFIRSALFGPNIRRKFFI